MGFLQTAFLFSLGALAIPVLLHLFSRWQTQKKGSSDRLPYDASVQRCVRPDQTIYVHTTFFNYGPIHREDVPVVVTARQGTKTARVRTTINALPEQAAESQIELGKLASGEWEISVEVDVDDDLSVDNRRIHAVAVDEPPTILLVREQDPDIASMSSSFFLRKALREGFERNQPRFSIQVVSISGAAKAIAKPSKWKAIVLTDATIADRGLIASLEQYVRQGGHVLAFTGQLGGEMGAAKWNDSPIAPGRFERLRIAGVVPFRLQPKEMGHSILQPFDDPQSGDLQRLSFRKAISIKMGSKAKQLASFDGDLPGIVEQIYEKGRLVWFLSDAGDAWSNWTSSPLYLPLVHQMVSDLAGLTGEGPIRFRAVGDPRSIAQEVSRDDTNVAVISKVKYSGDTAGPSAIQLAESVFADTGFVRQDNSLYVVNTPESESDTARMSDADLRLAFALQEQKGSADVAASTEVQSIRKQELWPWLASLMVVLLVFEFGLSNRTPP